LEQATGPACLSSVGRPDRNAARMASRRPMRLRGEHAADARTRDSGAKERRSSHTTHPHIARVTWINAAQRAFQQRIRRPQAAAGAASPGRLLRRP
jgi:hypothetical protein